MCVLDSILALHINVRWHGGGDPKQEAGRGGGLMQITLIHQVQPRRTPAYENIEIVVDLVVGMVGEKDV